MTFLVTHTALHDRPLAEDRADRLPERLGAVDDEQDPLLGIEAALDKVRQQRGGDGGVLGRALPKPERDLHALGGDPERDDVGAAFEVDPVDHHHRQAHVIQAAGHERLEVLARARDELARDRRLRGRPGVCFDVVADGLAGALEASRRDAGEHLLEHHPRERVTVGEVPIGHQRHLGLAVGRPHARSLDRDAPPAERDRAALGAVTDSGAIGVVLALGPTTSA
jgi:hypothetical protein